MNVAFQFELLNPKDILDALPSMVFIFDDDLRIMYANSAAQKTLGKEPELFLSSRCGDTLHCIHSFETTEGCGNSSHCKKCVVRNSVGSATKGKKIYREKNRMCIKQGNEEKDVVFLVSATPFMYKGEVLAIVVFEDISELEELREVVPICASCKKVRNDKEYWETVENYLKKHMDLSVTHSICPTCKKALYPELP